MTTWFRQARVSAGARMYWRNASKRLGQKLPSLPEETIDDCKEASDEFQDNFVEWRRRPPVNPSESVQLARGKGGRKQTEESLRLQLLRHMLDADTLT